jgi:EAL domain-containing protein (putative c-di-GMP-specific phosphodiesterase class I)
LETVAEWVGDAEEVELLRKYGVNYLQGFYLGAPRMELPGVNAQIDLIKKKSA